MLSLYVPSIVGEYYEVPILPEVIIEEPVEVPRYREITVYVTAYSQGDDCDTGDTMANGEKVHEGAVAYNGVPFGTKIHIDDREYTVKDRVGSDDVVDIYMDSVSRCSQWGRQRKIVKIED